MHILSTPTHAQPPPPSASPPDGAFDVTDEPVPARCHHPESYYSRGHSWCLHCVDLDKLMTRGHHYSAVPSGFPDLKLCSTSSALSPP